MDALERKQLIEQLGLTVAIDGPAGSGKSTVAKRLAALLDIGYLDTGAMYRSLTWYCLSEGIAFEDEEAVVQAADRMPLIMDSHPDDPHYWVGGTEVTSAIREPQISESIMAVSTNLGVRQWMAAEQRNRMLDAADRGSGMIAEGRDITTVVCPEADVRVLLLADPEARLTRRTLELYGSVTPELLEATRKQIDDRDAADSTVSQFFTPAPGVHVVDSSRCSVEEVIDKILALVDENLLGRTAEHRGV